MSAEKVDVLIVTAIPPIMIENMEKYCRLHLLWEQSDSDAFLAKEGKNIRGVVTRANTGIKKPLMDALPNLEIISSFGVGLDAIDVVEAHQRGIHVTNTPIVLNECVADTALALMLSVSRRVCEADRYARAGAWLNAPFTSASKMTGKICGIAGFGNIGREVAKRVAGFNMPIHYYDPFVSNVEGCTKHDTLAELAAAVDFLVMTLPGGKETYHIVDKNVLDALGNQGILVNVARGTVVDSDAVVAALQEKTILGAGLDVFEHEPNIPEALLEMDNVVLLPHIASNTFETRKDMEDLTVNNLLGYFKDGTLITPVKK